MRCRATPTHMAMAMVRSEPRRKAPSGRMLAQHVDREPDDGEGDEERDGEVHEGRGLELAQREPARPR